MVLSCIPYYCKVVCPTIANLPTPPFPYHSPPPAQPSPYHTPPHTPPLPGRGCRRPSELANLAVVLSAGWPRFPAAALGGPCSDGGAGGRAGRRLLGEDGESQGRRWGLISRSSTVVAVLKESFGCAALGGVLRMRNGGRPLGRCGG
jgi:hypothetical protein